VLGDLAVKYVNESGRRLIDIRDIMQALAENNFGKQQPKKKSRVAGLMFGF